MVTQINDQSKVVEGQATKELLDYEKKSKLNCETLSIYCSFFVQINRINYIN